MELSDAINVILHLNGDQLQILVDKLQVASFELEVKCLDIISKLEYDQRVPTFTQYTINDEFRIHLEKCFNLFKKYHDKHFYIIVDYCRYSGNKQEIYIEPVECYHEGNFPYDIEKLKKAEPLIGFNIESRRFGYAVKSRFFNDNPYKSSDLRDEDIFGYYVKDFVNQFRNVTLFSRKSLVMLI